MDAIIYTSAAGTTAGYARLLGEATGLPVYPLAAANPVSTLQGGFHMDKLYGVYKLMVNVMIKTTGKALAEKQDKIPEEAGMPDLPHHGGNRAGAENLTPVLTWYGENAQP